MSQDVVLHVERDMGWRNAVVNGYNPTTVGAGAVFRAGILIESDIPQADTASPVVGSANQQVLCVPYQVVGEFG